MTAAGLFDLTGQVAIVTGGSRGIGFQMARALGQQGASLVLTARKAAELDAARAELAAEGIRALTLVCDQSDPAAAGAITGAALTLTGRIEILVNNAGTTWGAPAEDYPDEGWRKVMALNLDAVFTLSREVARRAMLPQGYGRIVNIASVTGLTGNLPSMEGTVAYNASKGGVISLTRAMAAEWGSRGVTVNAIAPGYFVSKMTKGTVDQHEAALLAHTPRGRLGAEQDLAGPVLLFASRASDHITGQTLAVDGGYSAL
ncbi:SDR family oxidoreductase [Falsigemmobacter intermedius]|uniref:SDR family oxidoreductase n=1 Tax=Falsigemmobacter intermedius TaxID=1553448 RepID=UPI003F0AB08E